MAFAETIRAIFSITRVLAGLTTWTVPGITYQACGLNNVCSRGDTRTVLLGRFIGMRDLIVGLAIIYLSWIAPSATALHAALTMAKCIDTLDVLAFVHYYFTATALPPTPRERTMQLLMLGLGPALFVLMATYSE